MSDTPNPILGVEWRADHMVITMRVETPLATQGFFQAIVALLAELLDATRAPSPGQIEMASWAGTASAPQPGCVEPGSLPNTDTASDRPEDAERGRDG